MMNHASTDVTFKRTDGQPWPQETSTVCPNCILNLLEFCFISGKSWISGCLDVQHTALQHRQHSPSSFPKSCKYGQAKRSIILSAGYLWSFVLCQEAFTESGIVSDLDAERNAYILKRDSLSMHLLHISDRSAVWRCDLVVVWGVLTPILSFGPRHHIEVFRSFCCRYARGRSCKESRQCRPIIWSFFALLCGIEAEYFKLSAKWWCYREFSLKIIANVCVSRWIFAEHAADELSLYPREHLYFWRERLLNIFQVSAAY